ncbi:uncharacterized protein LOC133921036 [Phragmites australis]|uniref:uncharacterized protein LOC133921036 n=1 Tax=Phragmites australis TaxID=29695 RepID=UPI002D786E8E|nr:uncharacterized protein LOC133921036 [Phragmites australis]
MPCAGNDKGFPARPPSNSKTVRDMPILGGRAVGKRRKNYTQEKSYRNGGMADPNGRRPRHHTAVNDVLSTLADASAALADVQRRLDLEFRASYPDHANPAKLVARVKRIQEEVTALKDLCRDLLAQKQELIDRVRTSLAVQRGTTQRLLAASGLPVMTDADETAHSSLNEVIDEWTAHVRPITGEDGNEDTNQILFSAIV